MASKLETAQGKAEPKSEYSGIKPGDFIILTKKDGSQMFGRFESEVKKPMPNSGVDLHPSKSVQQGINMTAQGSGNKMDSVRNVPKDEIRSAERVSKGDSVQVKLKNGNTITGNFESYKMPMLGANKLYVNAGGKSEEIPMQNIDAINVVKNPAAKPRSN